MIFYDKETINRALELNENIQFEVVNFNTGTVVKSSKIFKNYEDFLSLYSTFPVVPSTEKNNKNLFMVQKFPNVINESFIEVTELCVQKTLTALEIDCMKSLRGNVGQYSKLKSPMYSIFPHLDSNNNFSMVCNYWVNVNNGDGTQFWSFEGGNDPKKHEEYIIKNYGYESIYDWYNIQETKELKKVYFLPAENNTCVFYFSNLLHSPVINETDLLRCSIVSWYHLKKKNNDN